MASLHHTPPLCIILNPNADKGRAGRKQKKIEALCKTYGLSYTILLTKKPLDAINLAKQAVLDGYSTIVAAGGDGTVNEVADGVVRGIRERKLSYARSPVVGLIPIGRGNDFAYSAHVPRSIEKAVELISMEMWNATDYGELIGGRYESGRCFLNGVGIGFEPLVNFMASDFKRIHGMASYLAGFIKVMMNYPKAISVKMVLDSSDTIEIETQQLSFCNGRRMGSMFIMGPQASIDDGLIDVVYANRPLKGREIVRLALRFFKGTQLRSAEFSMKRAQSVTITTADNSIVCHADGEEVSRGCDQIEVRLFPGELKFLRNI
ncbi:MAG: diacylglycerol kinase family protein [Sphaerochaetaceae bacterium]|nr:diacylglycerol kinase family protein [Sphaerochaetaceae bacterium]MDC7248278.1 diacylglycerol kinase family protein [Sphaerochaetaceae bacterium]